MTQTNPEKSTVLELFNRAVSAITINSRQSSRQQRQAGIEFLAGRSANPDVIKIFADALRRFGQNFTEPEKIRIAEILRAQDDMPPLTVQSLKDSLEKIIVQEKSPRAHAALHAALVKHCG